MRAGSAPVVGASRAKLGGDLAGPFEGRPEESPIDEIQVESAVCIARQTEVPAELGNVRAMQTKRRASRVIKIPAYTSLSQAHGVLTVVLFRRA